MNPHMDFDNVQQCTICPMDNRCLQHTLADIVAVLRNNLVSMSMMGDRQLVDIQQNYLNMDYQ